MSALAQALLEFQKNAPDLHRDATNPHFQSKFLSLEGLMAKVIPAANAAGLVISQSPTTVDTFPALRTRIIHAESGEEIEDVMLLMPGKQDPQGQGSAITYARRYSLMAALGLVADEDDDGNGSAAEVTSAVDGAAGSSPSAAENPAEAARRAQQAAGATHFSEARPYMTEEQYLALHRNAMAAGAVPSQQIVSFGKNKGVLLSELTTNQLRWYAEDWQPQDDPSPYDLRLKAAAVALFRGDDTSEALKVPGSEIPF
jgi:ERF superfamily protein